MPLHFGSARLKLERAKHHIDDLDRQVGKFFASGAVTVTIEDYPERAQRAVVRKTNRPVPNEFSLVLGDAIHNARAALDLMTWEAITPYTQMRKAVQFPVGRDEDHFLKQMLPSRQITSASPEIVAAFTDLQAYENGNGHDLWLLHELDIQDKHQLIVVVAAVTLLRNFSPMAIDPSGATISISYEGDVDIVFGGEFEDLFCWPLTSRSLPLPEVRRRFRSQQNVGKTLAIAFGAEPALNQMVIPTLGRILAAVERAIDRVATAL